MQGAAFFGAPVGARIVVFEVAIFTLRKPPPRSAARLAWRNSGSGHPLPPAAPRAEFSQRENFHLLRLNPPTHCASRNASNQGGGN
jgi:hypothetical protein